MSAGDWVLKREKKMTPVNCGRVSWPRFNYPAAQQPGFQRPASSALNKWHIKIAQSERKGKSHFKKPL